MITEKQFLEAQSIVYKYKKQQQELAAQRSKTLKEEAEKRYKKCAEEGGHDFRPSGGKWSSATQMSCVDCGYTID